MLTQVKFIRVDDDVKTEKVFNNIATNSPFQSLSAGEIVDVDCEDGSVKEYVVTDRDWEFTHFGNILVITIKPFSKA